MSSSTAVRAGRPGFVWVAPALTFFGLFALLPMVVVVYLSFTAYDGLNPPQWVGLQNWTRIGTDPLFVETLRLSFVLTAASWVLQTAVALPLGVWLARRGRSRALLAAIFFIPLLGAAIGATMGALAGSLSDVGIDDDFIRTVRDNVTPGTSALFVMTSNVVADKVIDQFRETGATLLSTNLSDEQESRLRAAFAEEA